MNLKKSLLLLLSLVLIAVLAACGGDDKKKDDDTKKDDKPDVETPADPEDDPADEPEDDGKWFPLVEDEIDMNVLYLRQPQNDQAGNDWNDLFIWDHYKEKTHVNVVWEGYLADALETQRNLSLEGSDIPDAYWLADWPMGDLERYGSEGVFIALEDLIAEHAPNLTEKMENDPAIRAAITFPDGHIYSMPSLVDEDFLSVALGARPWINTEHVDEYFEGNMPQTTEEFYQFLLAIKEAAPAGPDTIPYGGTASDELVEWMTGAFGVMNKGPANDNIDLGDDGDVRFYANTDDYKELLTYLNKLWEDELIDQKLFEDDWGHFTANAGPDGQVYSAYVFYDPLDFFADVEKPDSVAYWTDLWEGMDVLTGPNGHQQYNKVAPSVWSISNFVITENNDNPEAAVKWMDYFYSDEGAEMYYMGVEDETFTKNEDGKAEYTEDITSAENWELKALEKLAWVGSINGILSADYFGGGESKAPSMDAADKIAPYTPEEIWPAFTFTDKENKVMQAQGSDVTTVAEEYRDQFITGTIDIEAEWDGYLKALEQSGLDDVIEVYQEAYNRYEEAK